MKHRERRRVLAKIRAEWNATTRPYDTDACVDGLVAAQAAATPDAVALAHDGRMLTYRQLEDRANRLARLLISLGAGPGVLVGISMDRSEGMVVGLLGILKSGAAYVPLDPAYPKDRLAFVLEDARIGLLVTEERLVSTLPDHRAQVVLLDASGRAAASAVEGGGPFVGRATAGDRAYVIYTSGSTGNPKGVEIPHRAVINFLTSMAERPGLGPSDRLLALASLSFDIAGLELWLPLTVGATVEIASRETASDGAALRALLEDEQITVLQATPSTFRLLLEAGWGGSLRLKALIGGEATPRELADRLLDRVGSLWNMYGPTETTIWSCVQPLRKGEPVLIGTPIANTQVHVLTEDGAPVPPGVEGELYIGGEGLAIGYLGRPDLTAERFVPNPFGQGRLYRTGDLCRQRPDGALEFLGRVDFQVKIRGHRIELGEIEATITGHPGVREAVVVAFEKSPGDQHLAAYVTRGRGARPAAELTAELRALIRRKLPEHMVPARFVVLDRLPLTANGKIDRRALPPPEEGSPEKRDFVAPRDETEAKLAPLFQSVLGLGAVGVNDDFFDLGGHSLLALRLMKQIERVFGRRLPMSVLLRATTVAELAEVIRRGDGALASSLVRIRRGGGRAPLYWLPGGGGISVLAFRTVCEHMGPDQPVYGLEAVVDTAQAPRDVPSMAAKYIEDIQAVQPKGPYHLAGFSTGSWVAYEMACQLKARGHEVGLLVVFDTPCEAGAKTSVIDGLRIGSQRARYHLKKLAGSKRGEVLPYVQRRLRDQAHVYRQRISQHSWALARDAFVRLGGPIPKTFQDVDKSNRQVIHDYATGYAPTTYPGRITIFLASNTSLSEVDPEIDPRLGWRHLAEQGHDVHRVPGNHLSMLERPHVGELAATLQRCLDLWNEPEPGT